MWVSASTRRPGSVAWGAGGAPPERGRAWGREEQHPSPDVGRDDAIRRLERPQPVHLDVLTAIFLGTCNTHAQAAVPVGSGGSRGDISSKMRMPGQVRTPPWAQVPLNSQLSLQLQSWVIPAVKQRPPPRTGPSDWLPSHQNRADFPSTCDSAVTFRRDQGRKSDVQ